MRLTLDTRALLTDRIPALTLDAIRTRGGRKFVLLRQRALAAMLWDSYHRPRQHARHAEAEWFSTAELCDELRTDTKERRIPKLLDPLYEFPKGLTGYSPRHGTCRPYRMRDDVRRVMADVVQRDDPLDAVLSFKRGESMPSALPSSAEVLSFDALPSNGILETLPEALKVPKVLPMSPDVIDRAIAEVEERRAREGDHAPLDGSKGPGSFSLHDAGVQLQECRRWTISVGGIPNLYRLQSTGRLGPIGLHVIDLPKVLRRMLLRGSGLVDVDISACYWSILLSIARHLSIPTPVIEEYRGERERWHLRWASTYGVPSPGAFKPITLSWLTGGSLSAHPTTAAAKAIGSAAARQFMHDPDALRLRREARKVSQRIARETLREAKDGRELVYRNAVDAELRPALGKAEAMGRRCNHAFVGFEQFAIRQVCRQVNGLAAIIYDGFVCATGQDPKGWSQVVRKASSRELAIPLSLSFEVTQFT
jgi:hypothetical protein